MHPIPDNTDVLCKKLPNMMELALQDVINSSDNGRPRENGAERLAAALFEATLFWWFPSSLFVVHPPYCVYNLDDGDCKILTQDTRARSKHG